MGELLPVAAAYLAQLAAADAAAGPGAASVCFAQQLPAAASLQPGTVLQQLVSYSRAIEDAVPSAAMARREFAWRNGWFLREAGPTPLHAAWLARAGCADLLADCAAAAAGGTGAASF